MFTEHTNNRSPHIDLATCLTYFTLMKINKKTYNLELASNQLKKQTLILVSF